MLHLAQPKGLSFLHDMRDVVGHVLDFGLEHFLKRDQPSNHYQESWYPPRAPRALNYQCMLTAIQRGPERCGT